MHPALDAFGKEQRNEWSHWELHSLSWQVGPSCSLSAFRYWSCGVRVCFHWFFFFFPINGLQASSDPSCQHFFWSLRRDFSKEHSTDPALFPWRLMLMLLLVFMGSTSAERENISTFAVLGRWTRGVKFWPLSHLSLWCSGELFIFSLFPHWRCNWEFFLKLSWHKLNK